MNYNYKHLLLSISESFLSILINYTAWIPAELGITLWCLRCVAKHLYNKLKARYTSKAKAPLCLYRDEISQSKPSSTVLFHEELVAATGEAGFIFFHFISLY